MKPPPLEATTRFWYGFGQLAEGVKNHAFAAFLLFYYTQVLGLSGRMAGMALALALVFDAVSDPLAGVVSDRWRSSWGRRHPFMYASALPLGVAFYAVFAPPAGLDEWGLFLWLLVTAVATRAAMTLYHVPHMALGAELSTDYAERTRIVFARAFFGAVGALTAGAAALLGFMRPTPAYQNGQLNPEAYPAFAATFAVVMTLTILASALGTRGRVPWLPRPASRPDDGGTLRSLRRDVREALSIPSFRALFLGVTAVFVAFGLGNSLGLHLATYFWHVTTRELFVWGVGAGVGTLGGMVFWTRVAVRQDKQPTFKRGLVIFIGFAAVPLFAKAVGLWPAEASALYLPLYVGCGTIYSFGLAAATVTGGSMMADVTDQDELLHGRRREGIFFGAIAFAAKTSVGLGSFLAGQLVDGVGLAPGARPDEVAPAVGIQLGLATGVALLALVGLALVFFSGYRITREQHAAIRARLDGRQAGAASA